MIAIFASILVLLATLSLAAFGALGVQQIKLIPMQICRNHQLTLQKNSLQTINMLEGMNSEVEGLRVAKQQAEIELAAAIASENGAAAAAATEEIEDIEDSQEALLATQQAALRAEQTASEEELIETTSEIESRLAQNLRDWSFLVRYSPPTVAAGPYQLAMEGDIDDDSEPAVYKKKDNFLSEQTSQSSWEIQIFPRTGNGMISSQWPTRMEISDDCKASVIERNGKWQPTLLID